VRICHLEDEMRIERYRIDPELHAEVCKPTESVLTSRRCSSTTTTST
jgi:hypothetical protein